MRRTWLEVERVAVPAEAFGEGWDLNALHVPFSARTSGLGSSRSTSETPEWCRPAIFRGFAPIQIERRVITRDVGAQTKMRMA
jgi:hypothetical protein